MASNETQVAIAALAIAVVAFIIACGQLLQQLFGTADGYRRCQPSVIGAWSNLVRLHFRWSSFRLEVRVTTPHFEIRSLADPKAKPRSKMEVGKRNYFAITGTYVSRASTLSLTVRKNDEDDEDEDEDVVTWASLLDALHHRQWFQLQDEGHKKNPAFLLEQEALREQNVAIVCLKPKTRSWDLMPPDIVRPVASTTLGTAISMAHRLGMVWIDLIPSEGRLRAEGHGQSLSATLMRGMGIVMEYRKQPSIELKSPSAMRNSLQIPSIDTDKMACGIIPGNKLFGLWDISLRSERGGADHKMIQAALWDMGVRAGSVDEVLESTLHANEGSWWPAFVDLMGLWSDWLLLNASSISNVTSPINHRVFTMSEVYEARVVWRWYLREAYSRAPYSKSPLSPQLQKVLNYYDTWAENWPERFHQYFRVQGNNIENFQYMEFFQTAFDETTRYFLSLNRKYSNSLIEPIKQPNLGRPNPNNFYAHLVVAHIQVNADSLKEADAKINAEQSRNDGRVGVNLSDSIFAERAFVYADNVPKIVDEMERRGFPGTDVEDAWWTLMLRGQAWEAAINRVANPAMQVPSSYHDSPTRVYIL